jgi:hypothetical protein
MCKKLCIAVGAVIVGLLVITFTGLGTLMQVKWNETRNWMDKQVPPETQLKQLQIETDKIDQDIKKNLGKLATQEVEAERLEASLNKLKDNQTALREEIAAMTTVLGSKEASKETFVVYNGKKVRPSELALRLESKVNDYEMHKSEIKTREQLLASKRQSLELAHQRIREMKEQKEELRVTIAKLETRIEQVKLKQVDCPVSMDDSQVSKCHALADKLDRQLAEEEKKSELMKIYGYDKAPKNSVREEKTTDDVLKAAKKALQDDDEKVVEQK